MNVIADTNVLVRAVLNDDEAQCRTARDVLRKATVVAVSLPTLCEFVWVLRSGAKLSRAAVMEAVRTLSHSANVVVPQAAVEAGLAMMQAGGDFADGVMAHEGRWLGGETFVSFDRKAVELLTDQGVTARLLR